MPSEKESPKKLTPLWVISIFVSLTEAVLGVAAAKTIGNIQVALIVFVIAFPLLIAGAFFACLWWKPWVFYSPGEYGRIGVQQYVDALKGNPPKIVRQTKDVEGPVTTVGNPDSMRLLFKAAGATWARSTKALDAGDGCIIQVSTKFLAPDGQWNLAEALAYVPGVCVDKGADGAHVLKARHASSGAVAP